MKNNINYLKKSRMKDWKTISSSSCSPALGIVFFYSSHLHTESSSQALDLEWLIYLVSRTQWTWPCTRFMPKSEMFWKLFLFLSKLYQLYKNLWKIRCHVEENKHAPGDIQLSPKSRDTKSSNRIYAWWSPADTRRRA